MGVRPNQESGSLAELYQSQVDAGKLKDGDLGTSVEGLQANKNGVALRYGVPLFIAFFGLIFSYLGFSGLTKWVVNLKLARDSENWMPVSATLTKYDVIYHGTDPTGRTSTLIIRYTFSYEGKDYEGGSLHFINSLGTKRDLPTVGEDLTVYFDTETKNSVVFPGRKGENYLSIFWSLPWYFIGLVLLRVAWGAKNIFS